MTRLSKQAEASSGQRLNTYERNKEKKREEKVKKNAIKQAFPRPNTGFRSKMGL